MTADESSARPYSISLLEINEMKQKKKQCLEYKIVPRSMETFLGRPHFLISFEPDKSCPNKFIIISSKLLKRAMRVLMIPPKIDAKFGNLNSLQRLAFGLNQLRKSQRTEITTMVTLNRDTCLWFYEQYISLVAKWLSYCEEFNHLPYDVQMRILNCIWLVWIRLERTAMAAEVRGQHMNEKMLINSYETAVSLEEFDVDCGWFTNYSKQQMKNLMDFLEADFIRYLFAPLIDVQPTEMELAFMLFQLCFHIAGRVLGTEIAEITGKLIDQMAHHLKDYYVEDTKSFKYSRRLYALLKINYFFEKYTMLRKEKVNIARVRDIFTVEFSDPELNNEIC